MRMAATAAALGLLVFLSTSAQGASPSEVIPLYEGTVPGTDGWTPPEKEVKGSRGGTIYNVSKPSLTVFRPQAGKANGTAAVIYPGGGFFVLEMRSEGYEVAEYLTARGVTCFVLKYRLMQCTTENPVAEFLTRKDEKEALARTAKLAGQDGLVAMKYVRAHAKVFGVEPDRVGIIGFSAGAAVTLSVALNHQPDSRPAFAAPIYAPRDALNSAGGKVPDDAPPLFTAAATDDEFNFAPATLEIYQAWVAAKRPAELHIYAKGGHGFGMKKQNLPSDTWAARFCDWLDMQDLLKKP